MAAEAPKHIAAFANRLYDELRDEWGSNQAGDLVKAAMPAIVEAFTRS